MILLKNRLPKILIVLGMLITAQAQAQDDRWFKVELMVFSQGSESSANSEAWDPSPVLEYPSEFRFLIHPDNVAANLANHDATGIVDEFGRQILTITPPLLDEYGDPLPPSETEIPLREADESAPEPVTGTPGETPLEEGLPPIAEPLPLTPTPFTTLAGSEMEFRGKAAYMQRTGRYQILFHQGWVQPVADEGRALPIVLDRSGDTGEWPKLQGSVKLYLSRYLHIETDLWLNTMGRYLPESWQIPPAPLGPQSLIIEYPELPELMSELAQEEEPPVEQQGLYGAVSELEAEPEIPVETGPAYPWKHAVVLQQKRKMRSTEVHYIDHPMLGVVVLVSPISDEELEAMAAVEFAPDGLDAASTQALK